MSPSLPFLPPFSPYLPRTPSLCVLYPFGALPIWFYLLGWWRFSSPSLIFVSLCFVLPSAFLSPGDSPLCFHLCWSSPAPPLSLPLLFLLVPLVHCGFPLCAGYLPVPFSPSLSLSFSAIGVTSLLFVFFPSCPPSLVFLVLNICLSFHIPSFCF